MASDYTYESFLYVCFLIRFCLFRIVCPDTMEDSMTIWTIMSKVRLEAFMWVCCLEIFFTCGSSLFSHC